MPYVCTENLTDMLSLNYLKSVLYDVRTVGGESVNVGLPSLGSADDVIESPDGLLGFVEMCQRKNVPMAVLFEDAFHYDDTDRNDVPVTRFRQNIYVVRMAAGNAPTKPIEDACFADLQRIRKVLLRHVAMGDTELRGWERTSQRDYVRGASNYVGWKLSLPFVENEDLWLNV